MLSSCGQCDPEDGQHSPVVRWLRGRHCVQGAVSHSTGSQTVPWDQLPRKGDSIIFFFFNFT